jgi:hypothetical protein
MTDEQIGEIYALARESFFGGQRAFQLQAYPFKMTALNMARHRNNPNMAFWKMLKVGYDHFAVTHLEPKVDVCERHYVFDAQNPGDPSKAVGFSPAGKCPTYEVPADILAAVHDKEQQDSMQMAELVSRRTPTAPVRTGTDGGMNPVFVAALSRQQQVYAGAADQSVTAGVPTAAGTIPPTVNPPQPQQAVYTVDATPTTSTPAVSTRTRKAVPVMVSVPMSKTAPVLASAESRPATPTESGGGFLSRIGRAIGFQGDENAEANAAAAATAKTTPRSRNVAVASHSRPKVQQHVATVPPAVAANPASKPALRGTTTASSSESDKPAALTAPIRPSLPPSATAMAAPTGPIRGAQPVLSTGSFDNRWSAMR